MNKSVVVSLPFHDTSYCVKRLQMDFPVFMYNLVQLLAVGWNTKLDSKNEKMHPWRKEREVDASSKGNYAR